MQYRSVIALAATACIIGALLTVSMSQKKKPYALDSAVNVATSATDLEKYFEYKTIKLENGLRVVMHRDTSIPFVSTAVYLHVGSKDEPEGKSGFAHLFEHLHFNGTPKNPGEYFNYLNELGASNANGTTDLDQTNYYQTIPKSSLERLLWLEADRLNNILDGVTEEKLQTQINVVKNEKNLSESNPFGNSMERSMSILFPKGHPYHHSTIGSVEDLENASMEDVRDWYAKHYGARNTVLSIAGDIEYDEVESLVRKHFSHITPGPAITQDERRHVKRVENTYHTVRDTSSYSQIVRNYVLPPLVDETDLAPAIAAEIMAGGENSPLYQALVEDKKLAVSVSSVVRYKQLATIVHIYAVAADGVALDDLADAMDEATQTYLQEGPSENDVERVFNSEETYIIENSTSTSAKAGMLAEALMYSGNPHHDIKVLDWVSRLTPTQIKASAQIWLGQGYHDERLIGESEYKALAASPAIEDKPAIGPTSPIVVPTPDIFTLSNGLKVVLSKRQNSPTVWATLNLAVGTQAYSGEDQVIPGLANNMLLSASHSNMTRGEIIDAKAKLGMSVEGNSHRLNTTYSMSGILPKFENSLKLWSQSFIDPTFSQSDFELALQEQRQSFLDASESPRVAAPDLSEKIASAGSDHLTYLERLEALKNLTRDDLLAHHKAVFQPQGSTLYIGGDFTVDNLQSVLEESFQNWHQTETRKPLPPAAQPETRTKPLFILVNDEGSPQTQITARRTTNIPYMKSDEGHSIANNIFGGGFTSRLNMNLREDKGWTYGISSSLRDNNDMLGVTIHGAVTASESLNAINEIIAEIRRLEDNAPITDEEIKDVVSPIGRSLALLFGDNLNTVMTLLENDMRGRPYNYQELSQARYEALSVADVRAISQELFKTDDLVWTIVGDISQFEDEIRAANIGDTHVYNLKGKRLR